MPRQKIDDEATDHIKLNDIASDVANQVVSKSSAIKIEKAPETPEEGITQEPDVADSEDFESFTPGSNEPLGMWELLSAGYTICLIDGKKKTLPSGDTYWDPPAVNVTVNAAKGYIDLDHPMPGEIDTQGTIPVRKLDRKHWELIRAKLIEKGATQITPKLKDLQKASAALDVSYKEDKEKIAEAIKNERESQRALAQSRLR